MNTTESTPIAGGQAHASAILAAESHPHITDGRGAAAPVRHRSGYGLPCAKCRTYYAADLPACPVCKTSARVSPVVTAIPAGAPVADSVPDLSALEEERERFLREFRSQIGAGNLQINAEASFRCSHEEAHHGAFEPASVCQSCYERLRERIDLAEAALLIDPKEAAQIVYAAVWADPSDPRKTYSNAAQALINELRRRAGISAVLGSLQMLQH